ncbi:MULTISPECIES: hypothetical protein [unclassified Stenotrophomonas]|uniref:hypothetical protein n=1 Tax=unclassified Stenotrophomonas TaxID=196198 RepID=UPI0012FF16AA|nr:MULTISPECIES: hypothetical protein [unclassified Stenotrophomonas]
MDTLFQSAAGLLQSLNAASPLAVLAFLVVAFLVVFYLLFSNFIGVIERLVSRERRK